MSKYAYMTANGSAYGMLKEFAHNNRKFSTEAERILWSIVRAGFMGVTFKRQHIVDNYIADLICLKKKLIIEIDGLYHQLPDQVISDEERTKKLNELGYKVIRFTNDEIISNTEGVIQRIKDEIKN